MGETVTSGLLYLYAKCYNIIRPTCAIIPKPCSEDVSKDLLISQLPLDFEGKLAKRMSFPAYLASEA